jgi:HD-GYP domain-containing protein (c-di-GMP phosphodiesterase class II)
MTLDKHQLDDSFVEHIFMFSPLHEFGKVGIPDSILLKPGKLDDGELEIMRTHARKGEEIVDELISNFGLENFEYRDVLRTIAACHHEAAIATLRELAGESLDQDCAEALVSNLSEVEEIQRHFRET